MMQVARNLCALIAAVATAAMIVGCADIDPPLPGSGTGFISKDDLVRCRVKMPPNANTQNFRKLGLAVVFKSIGGVDRMTGKPLEIDQELSRRLQVDMGKIKRFTIIDLHSGGDVIVDDFVDAGIANIPETVLRQIDLLLVGSITIYRDVHNLLTEKKVPYTLYRYDAEFDFICRDIKDGTQKFSEKVHGKTSRKEYPGTFGLPNEGFVPGHEGDLIGIAAMEAISQAVNKIANTYPAGGRVISCTTSGERMTLDRGFEQGILGGQQCVVFANDDGVDIPLCYANAEPSDNTSSIVPYKWNNAETDAKLLKTKFGMDPKAFIKNYPTFVVGYGVPFNPMDVK